MFFFGGLQSIFVEQKLQNVRVKVPCRHMLNFFMFNELYGFRALQKEPCCQFAEKKKKTLSYQQPVLFGISMGPPCLSTQLNVTNYWRPNLVKRHDQVGFSILHH